MESCEARITGKPLILPSIDPLLMYQALHKLFLIGEPEIQALYRTISADDFPLPIFISPKPTT